VATDRDAVYDISRMVANGSRSGQPDHKQHPTWTNESAELIESFSVVDVVEHRYSGDGVERIFLDLTGEQISNDVLDVIARSSRSFDARSVGIEPHDEGHPLSQPSCGFSFAAPHIETPRRTGGNELEQPVEYVQVRVPAFR